MTSIIRRKVSLGVVIGSRAFFSPGTHYLLTPNLELGVRIGWGITDDAPRFFSNVGIGWRF